MNGAVLVCDTSLLLYLGHIRSLQLLPQLHPTILIPAPVVFELDVGRSLLPDVVNPRELGFAVIEAVSQAEIDRLPANRLGEGERAVIALARRLDAAVAGLDDRQARLFALSLGLKVKGVVGLIVDAKKSAIIPSAATLLIELRESGFRLDPKLFLAAVELAGEHHGGVEEDARATSPPQSSRRWLSSKS